MTPSRCDNDNDNLSCQLSVHQAQHGVSGPLAHSLFGEMLASRGKTLSRPRDTWKENGPVLSAAFETGRGT